MNIIFIVLALIHVLIWAFVLLAFIDKRLARINLLYVIPIIYLLHIFPYLFKQIVNFFNFSFMNPFSAQGMLIFGAITSGYRLLL